MSIDEIIQQPAAPSDQRSFLGYETKTLTLRETMVPPPCRMFAALVFDDEESRFQAHAMPIVAIMLRNLAVYRSPVGDEVTNPGPTHEAMLTAGWSLLATHSATDFLVIGGRSGFDDVYTLSSVTDAPTLVGYRLVTATWPVDQDAAELARIYREIADEGSSSPSVWHEERFDLPEECFDLPA